MSNTFYELTIVSLLRSLKKLDDLISKAEAYVEQDKEIDEKTMVQARLFPNMRPFVFQIRVATDTAKGAAARLTGSEVPSWADDEETLAQLHERVGKAITFLSGFKAEDFDGAESRSIELKLGPNFHKFTAHQYLCGFVVPNFHFHMTTAYNILRHSGVALGKRDYLGEI